MTYATDPTTLRSEARDIEIGAPDGDGYAGWLRACADTIESLERQITEKRQLKLAFAAGFLAASEGDNGECNRYTDTPSNDMTPEKLLAIDKAKIQLGRDFDHWINRSQTAGGQQHE